MGRQVLNRGPVRSGRLLEKRHRRKKKQLAFGVLEARLDEDRAAATVQNGAFDDEPRPNYGREELDLYVQREKPTVSPLSVPRAHRAKGDEIDVSGREAAEELLAEVLHRRYEGHVHDETSGGLFEDPPVRTVQEVAGRVARTHQAAGFRIPPDRAHVVGDGHEVDYLAAMKALCCPCLVCLLAACGGEKLVLGGDGDAGCVPGTYVGTYQCNTDPDSSLQATGSGSMSVTLVGDRGGPSLFIASGTKVSSTQLGVATTSDLSGSLDCLTNRLQGTLSQVSFSSASFNGAFNGTGQLSADYDASASRPALVDGIMVPPEAEGTLGGLQAQGTCTWTATLQ